MTDKFQNSFRIQSARAQWWNYGWNASYFVTICSAHREHFFGEIINGNDENQPIMQLSEIGQLAGKFWWSIPEHFPFVKLDAFLVMPNHIHGILMIDKPDDGHDMDGIGDMGGIDVETGQCPVSTNAANNAANAANEPKTPGELRFRNQGKDTLSSIVGSFKSVVTKYAHRIHAEFEWQERFHDHIIRDVDEYCRIANYIENNVANWHDDKFYEP